MMFQVAAQSTESIDAARSLSDPSVRRPSESQSQTDADLEALCNMTLKITTDDEYDEASPTPSSNNTNTNTNRRLAAYALPTSAASRGSSSGDHGMDSTSAVPLPQGVEDLVIDPDPVKLPKFNSFKLVEEILVDQAKYGKYMRAAPYDAVVSWFQSKRPPGVAQAAAMLNASAAPGLEDQQVFLGQIPAFANGDWLCMCLEFVYGIPGSVLSVAIRRESSTTHAGYAVATCSSPEHVPKLIELSRHIFLGSSHVFFTEPASMYVHEFQRIIARVMAIDAMRPHSELRTKGFARACLVVAHANAPGGGGGGPPGCGGAPRGGRGGRAGFGGGPRMPRGQSRGNGAGMPCPPQYQQQHHHHQQQQQPPPPPFAATQPSPLARSPNQGPAMPHGSAPPPPFAVAAQQYGTPQQHTTSPQQQPHTPALMPPQSAVMGAPGSASVSGGTTPHSSTGGFRVDAAPWVPPVDTTGQQPPVAAAAAAAVPLPSAAYVVPAPSGSNSTTPTWMQTAAHLQQPFAAPPPPAYTPPTPRTA